MYESAIYDWYLSSHWEAQLIHIPTFVFCYCNKTVTTFTTVKGFFPPNSCCKWFRPFRSGPTTKYMSQRWHTISCRACHYRSLGVAPHYQGCHDMPTQSMMHSICGIVLDLSASVWLLGMKCSGCQTCLQGLIVNGGNRSEASSRAMTPWGEN